MSTIEVKNAIDEITSIDVEIKTINKKAKILRARRLKLLEIVSKYLESTNNTSIRYKGKLYSIEKQTKLVSKK